MSRYRKAEACLGSGYLGLLPRHRERGNRKSQLPSVTQTVLLESIDNDYEALKQKTRLACWAAFKRRCDDGGIVAPSYVTYCAAVKKRNKFTQTMKRLGRRAAYKETARGKSLSCGPTSGCIEFSENKAKAFQTVFYA